MESYVCFTFWVKVHLNSTSSFELLQFSFFAYWKKCCEWQNEKRKNAKKGRKVKKKNCYNLGVNKCNIMTITSLLLCIVTHCLHLVFSVYIHFIPFLVPFIWNHRNYSISQYRSSTDSKDSGLFWLYIFWRFPVISSKFFSIRATSSFACEYLMFILFYCFPFHFHFHWVSSWCDNDAKKRNAKKKWTH